MPISPGIGYKRNSTSSWNRKLQSGLILPVGRGPIVRSDFASYW